MTPKSLLLTRSAATARRKYGRNGDLALAKMTAYAADPKAGANNVRALKGVAAFRMRVGDFRVIFQETEDTITILDIGPRGGIYG